MLGYLRMGWLHEYPIGRPCPGYLIGTDYPPYCNVKIVRSIDPEDKENFLVRSTANKHPLYNRFVEIFTPITTMGSLFLIGVRYNAMRVNQGGSYVVQRVQWLGIVMEAAVNHLWSMTMKQLHLYPLYVSEGAFLYMDLLMYSVYKGIITTIVLLSLQGATIASSKPSSLNDYSTMWYIGLGDRGFYLNTKRDKLWESFFLQFSNKNVGYDPYFSLVMWLDGSSFPVFHRKVSFTTVFFKGKSASMFLLLDESF